MSSLGRLRHAVKEPKIFQFRRIQPRFDVSKVAIVDDQFTCERLHVVDNNVSIRLSKLQRFTDTQTKVVIAPDSPGLRIGEGLERKPYDWYLHLPHPLQLAFRWFQR